MSQMSRAAQLQGLALSIAARQGGAMGLEELAERQHGLAEAAMLKHLLPGDAMVALGVGSRLAGMLREQMASRYRHVMFVDDDAVRLEQSTAAFRASTISHRVEGPLDDLKTNPAQLSRILARTPASDLASYRVLEAALARQRQDHPLVQDGSIDAVMLDGIAAMMGSAPLGRVVEEAFRVLRRGGQFVMSGLLLDERIGDAHLEAGMGALPLEQEVASMLVAAGYHGVTYRWRAELPWKIVDGAEARAFVLEAYKGKQGVCIDQGHAVMYRGPWRTVFDDDGHCYVRGERTAVCKKTYDLLERAPYQGQFIGLVPYVIVPEDQAPIFDCRTPAIREPAVTKSTRSVVAGPGSKASCDGADCCQPSRDQSRDDSKETDMKPLDISNATQDDMRCILTMLEGAALSMNGVSDESPNFLAARYEGDVVGGVAMEGHGSDVLLRSLVVAPTAWNRGIGTQLVSALLDRARDQARARVYLMTTTAETFFERFGFQRIPVESLPAGIRTSEQFDGCCAAGASAMVLSLAGAEDALALKDEIRRKYSSVANATTATINSSCCSPGASSRKTQVTRDLYSPEQATCLPSSAKAASRGCGSPTDALDLAPGETVLDLGSGAGADVFLAARRVGTSGKVYGLDMTPEMIELARKGQTELGLHNVEFMLGEMERIPLPEMSVDAVVSNCVISLVKDKDRVFREIARVLRPGGRMSISDIVSTHSLPSTIRDDLNLWLGCLGGALLVDEYRAKLERAGFIDINIDIKRVYNLEELLTNEVERDGRAPQETIAAIRSWGGQVCSASVTATRPTDVALVAQTASARGAQPGHHHSER